MVLEMVTVADLFENKPFKDTSAYIAWLVKKKNSLQHHLQIAEGQVKDIKEQNAPYMGGLVGDDLVKAMNRVQRIEKQIETVDEELKGFDHRNTDKIIKGNYF